MPFPPEQSKEIKEQLIAELEKLPNENKEQIKEYIIGLDDEGLEAFLKKNKIQVSETGIQQQAAEQKCIFCSIAKNEIPSYKIAESKKAIAILEINPLSKGHVIIIPTEHIPIEKLPKSALSLSQKIAKKIKKKLKPDDIKIETSSLQDHPMINVIPLYKNSPLKKVKASEEELKQLKTKLETKTRTKRGKQEKQANKETVKIDLSKLPKYPIRIP